MDKVFEDGYIIHKNHKERYVVATGNMIHLALEVAEKISIGIIEIFRYPINDEIKDIIDGNDIYVLEENNSKGGLSSAIYEFAGNLIKSLNHRALDLSNGYDCVYGGRANIQKHYGLDKESIVQWLKSDS